MVTTDSSHLVSGMSQQVMVVNKMWGLPMISWFINPVNTIVYSYLRIIKPNVKLKLFALTERYRKRGG